MSDELSRTADLKEKARHELVQFLGIFLYLAFFFCALTAYSMLLLHKYDVSYYSFGAAIVNALVIAKVILIGEYAHLGKKHETKPLLWSAIYKAFLFSLLVFGFHIVEELIKLLFAGETIASGFQKVRFDDLLARTMVIFCTFIPLFAFRELQRVLGDDSFFALFLGGGTRARPLSRPKVERDSL